MWLHSVNISEKTILNLAWRNHRHGYIYQSDEFSKLEEIFKIFSYYEKITNTMIWNYN